VHFRRRSTRHRILSSSRTRPAHSESDDGFSGFRLGGDCLFRRRLRATDLRRNWTNRRQQHAACARKPCARRGEDAQCRHVLPANLYRRNSVTVVVVFSFSWWRHRIRATIRLDLTPRYMRGRPRLNRFGERATARWDHAGDDDWPSQKMKYTKMNTMTEYSGCERVVRVMSCYFTSAKLRS